MKKTRKTLKSPFDLKNEFSIKEFTFKDEGKPESKAYFVVKGYRFLWIPITRDVKVFLSKEEAEKYLNSILIHN
jgi:hypothetical protein